MLLFYLHPWEFEKMPEKYEYDEGTFYFKPELYKNCCDFMEQTFERYIQLTWDDGFQFTTCDDFYDIWKRYEDERSCQ